MKIVERSNNYQGSLFQGLFSERRAGEFSVIFPGHDSRPEIVKHATGIMMAPRLRAPRGARRGSPVFFLKISVIDPPRGRRGLGRRQLS